MYVNVGRTDFCFPSVDKFTLNGCKRGFNRENAGFERWRG